MLQFEYASKDAIPEALRDHYKESNGKFFLDGYAPKNKVDEFRENNVKLVKEIGDLKSKYKDVDTTKYNLLLEMEKKMNSGDPRNQEDAPAWFKDYRKQSEERISTLEKEKEEAVRNANKASIENYIRDHATKAGVIPNAMDDVLRRAHDSFEYTDGSVKAISGKTDGKGNTLTPDLFLEGLKQSNSYLFKSSGGSGASGSGEGKPSVKKISPSEANTPEMLKKVDSGEVEIDFGLE